MRCSFIVALLAITTSAWGGPVEVYREGPRYCPRDRSSTSTPINEPQAIALTRALVPDNFCGPTRFVAGCDVQVEYEHGSWRVYVHQYRQRPNRNDWAGLMHTYVILDDAGNCLANIPGTPFGSAN